VTQDATSLVASANFRRTSLPRGGHSARSCASAMSSSLPSDVETLRRELEAARLEAARERARAGSYAEEIRALKQRHLEAQTAVEREEEFLTNNLMKKLDRVSNEKREMLMRVEQEEEFLTNALQKRLDRVLREKHELEVRMTVFQSNEKKRESDRTREEADLARAREEELVRERARLTKEKIEVERLMETEQEAIVNKLTKQTSSLRSEKVGLREEREELRRRVETLLSERRRLRREKVQLENTLEQEEENIVNRLQAQIVELHHRNQILLRRLEQGGSQTPSVVSESDRDASEDEGGFSRRGFARTQTAARPGGGSARGFASHAPWERDMYGTHANVSRRKSLGSASVSSAGTGGGRGTPKTLAPAGAGDGDSVKRDSDDEGSESFAAERLRRGSGGSTADVTPYVDEDRKAMSVGGSSAATTPRSSVANTPLTTPRAAAAAAPEAR